VVNVVRATIEALTLLRDPVEVRRERLALAGRLPAEPEAPVAPEAAPATTGAAAEPSEAAAPPAAE